MQALRKPSVGSMVPGIPPMLAESLPVPLVTRFGRDFPKVTLRVRDASRGCISDGSSLSRSTWQSSTTRPAAPS